uniref:Uncharacterized protein n=1 Tax=Arundo donax TaxID=35708 RepID=A0A0A8ZJQ4_ARUDO
MLTKSQVTILIDYIWSECGITVVYFCCKCMLVVFHC